ncbi:hypothetical protein KUV65_06735 [Maritalea mobilis]|uniref:hypothetical protein n=1 Tax=Maritalea mobilis TaxID=483324 RepID=UPI001C9578FD|nr:hypothetical protein [Maritalea mobilis]MBY6201050.1 hypothetical protein [Maritalea mobilis]
MKRSEHTNAEAGKVLEPEDISTGLAISCYLAPDSDVPSMDFFHSEHCFGVCKAPSLLPLTTHFGAGAIFGCAVDVEGVHRFLEGLAPLGRKINETGRCRSDEPDFNGSYLSLNEQGEELLEELHNRMEDFIQSADWIDKNIQVVDCLEHWTAAKISEVLTPSMSEAEACEALQVAQDAAQDETYRIIGPVETVLQEYEEYWLGQNISINA